MKKIILRLGRFFNFYLLLTLPLPALAIELPGDVGITVPSTDIDSVSDFYIILGVATSWILVFGLLIGVLFVIWGGVKYITSGGDDTKAKDAKSIILYALIGTVFLILAVALIKIIVSFFGVD
ncbi:MAG: hypothetical protein Q7S09_05700 [bacterium]|nr:hypothetical protein [bacterium]